MHLTTIFDRRFSWWLLAFLLAPALVQAENWPHWRGPRLDGTSTEKGLPVKWSKTENVAWRFDLPGIAGSTPVVWGDRIFLTSADGEDLVLLCVSTQGKQLWRHLVGKGGKAMIRGDEGNFASPSPTTDGKHIWTMMGNGLLACYTVEGKPVWNFDVQDRYGKLKIAFGMPASLIVDGDRLYVQLIHGEGNPQTREAVVVCVNKETGAEIWKQDRASDARDECEHSYASPTLYRDEKRAYLLTHGADYVVAHDLYDGHEIWRCGDLNPKGSYNPTLRFVSSPVAADGMIVVPSAKGGPVFAIKPEAMGDITDKEDAFFWKRPRGTPDVPSPLIHDGIVYLFRENGNLVAVDSKTGKDLYEKRTTDGRSRTSPLFADGKIYIASRTGVVNVVKAGKEFELLSQNKMEEDISSSFAVSNGRIYIRTWKALYAIGGPTN